MSNTVARKSEEKSVSHQSESFQDLEFNHSAPSVDNDRISAESLFQLENNKCQRSAQTASQNNPKYQQELIAYLKKQNEKLKKNINDVNSKLNSIDDEKTKLQRILLLSQKQNTQLKSDLEKVLKQSTQLKENSKNDKQLIQKLSKALHLNQINIEKINTLQSKNNSLQQQLSFYEKSDQQIRSFLKNQLKMEFNSSKTTKSIVQSIISQMRQNRNQISQQISQLIDITGQNKKQSQDENYNHWKQVQKLQQVSQFMIKNKNQISHQKAMIQSLYIKINSLQQLLRQKK